MVEQQQKYENVSLMILLNGEDGGLMNNVTYKGVIDFTKEKWIIFLSGDWSAKHHNHTLRWCSNNSFIVKVYTSGINVIRHNNIMILACLVADYTD